MGILLSESKEPITDVGNDVTTCTIYTCYIYICYDNLMATQHAAKSEHNLTCVTLTANTM